MHRLPLLLWLSLSIPLLGACATPGTRAPEAAPPGLADTGSTPDWLPVHRNPRPGDWAEHRRLSPQGMTGITRRTEVLALDGDRLALRHSYGDAAGKPYRVVHLTVSRDGRVQGAHLADGTGLALTRGERSETRLKRAEPLDLVSGRHRVRRIVQWRGADGVSQVYYLAPDRPFAEAVSLTTRRALGTGELNRLLGRIAVPEPRAGGDAVQGGWVLTGWGRGAR